MRKLAMDLCFLFVLITATVIISCDSPQTDTDVKMIRETKGSIFTTVQTKHSGNFDIRCTTDTIHNDLGLVIKVISHIDTIPQLSITRDTLATGKTYVNKNGDEVDKDTIVVHPKEYQMYISVKN